MNVNWLIWTRNPKETYFRDLAHTIHLILNILTLVPEVSTGKLIKIFCLLLSFPSTFIKLCHACKELKSNENAADLGGGG